VPALAEMFSHLGEQEVRDVCADLAASGVEDIDACVRRLLGRAGASGEATAVSLAPVCCAGGQRDADAAAALLEPQELVPDTWSEAEEQLFLEMLRIQVPPVRARKAIDLGGAEDLDEAVCWLERHQEDPDIDVPVEVLQEREDTQLALDVLRVATTPAAHRLECFRALHQVFHRIMADPESERVRKLRVQNPKFKEKIGRFPQAVALLRRVGFVKSDIWVSAFQRETCLEFPLPVDSDNPASQRFVRAYSLIDEVLQEPDRWFPAVSEAAPEVESEWSLWEFASGAGAPTGAPEGAGAGAPQAASRAYLAELHARRARDPRAFSEAMLAAGKRANPAVVDVRPSAPPPPDSAASSARELSGAAAASSSEPGRGYRRLAERFPGRREFNLDDLEQMRVQDAIAGTPLYAVEYDRAKGSSSSYGSLVSRMYDPQYLGRRAVDETNVFRGQQRLPPLRWSQALADIAEVHAKQMARGEMPFSHLDFDKRVAQYPFPHMSAAENLAMNGGVSDAAGTAVQGWIKSPGHRKNLLGSFDLCGVGAARSGSGEFFFTQLFARTYGALC